MATETYDAVIIGSGHNGLIVGNYLAMAGLSVCVLEAKNVIGGCTATVECTLPGFKHDIGSVALGAIQSNPVYADDELGIREKYGFEFIDTKKNGATLYPDGTGVLEDGDLAHELEQIAAYSPEDAQAYGQFIQEKARLLPLISTGMSTCPPPMGLFVNQLNSTPEGRDLFKSMSMTALQMAQQWFKHPKTISHVLKISTEVMVTPEDAGSAMWMMFVAVGNAFRSGSLPKGGSIALPNALAAALKDRGGKIVLNKKVTKINVENGRAVSVETEDGDVYVGTKAIISNVDARRVFLEMVDGYELDPKFKRDLEQIVPAPMSGVMQAVAIDDAPHYKAGSRVRRRRRGGAHSRELPGPAGRLSRHGRGPSSREALPVPRIARAVAVRPPAGPRGQACPLPLAAGPLRRRRGGHGLVEEPSRGGGALCPRHPRALLQLHHQSQRRQRDGLQGVHARLLQRVEREHHRRQHHGARAPICSRATPIALCPRSASSAR